VFTISPGNTEIVKGEDVNISARIEGPRQNAVTLLSRPTGQAAFEESALTRGSDDAWHASLFHVRVSTEYSVRIGSVQSDTYLLKVLDRPVVNALQLHLTYPAYSALPTRWLDENVGDVQALAEHDQVCAGSQQGLAAPWRCS
jgi:hypothetical protein